MAPWKMTCVSATVASKKPEGGDWDPVDSPASAPDPFCEFQFKEKGLRDTITITDTLAPAWNENITPPNIPLTSAWLINEADSWSILVADYDVVNNEAVCQDFPRFTAATFTAGTYVVSRDGCTDLTLRLTCED